MKTKYIKIEILYVPTFIYILCHWTLLKCVNISSLYVYNSCSYKKKKKKHNYVVSKVYPLLLLTWRMCLCGSGEILCQRRDPPERLPLPLGRPRAIPIAAAQNNNANSIDRPSKQTAGKQPQKQQNVTQKQTTPTPPVSVKELFNSSSCVEPPFTCPHPRIQFFLYTR